MVKIPCFYCKDYGFDPWSGKFHILSKVTKKKKKFLTKIKIFPQLQ